MNRNVSVPLPVLGYVAAVFVSLFLCNYALNRLSRMGARAEQDRIVAAIETFRAQHGRLPDSLKEAGIEVDPNVFDVIYIKEFIGPNEFELSCRKDYLAPMPSIHWWYYSSVKGVWEYKREFV